MRYHRPLTAPARGTQVRMRNHNFEDFLEAFVRVACVMALPTDEEARAHTPAARSHDARTHIEPALSKEGPRTLAPRARVHSRAGAWALRGYGSRVG